MKTLQKTPEEKTLQDCKEIIAKKTIRAQSVGFYSWQELQDVYTKWFPAGLITAMDEAAELYAKTVSEQRDKEIEELRGCLQDFFISYVLDVNSDGEPNSSIGRLIEISTKAKNLLEKHKLNN